MNALPTFDGESFHLIEMVITRYDCQIMLLGSSCDPDIVFRDWTALLTKYVFDQAVLLGRC